MRSLRLRQFRSFIDTEWYDLKPITLLVGANSSGKSSYLRFFPLLRQTEETPTRSPLLWFGRYVDFGNFTNAAFRGADTKTISIDIRTAVAMERAFGRVDERTEVPLDISITLAAQENQTYVSNLEIKSWDDTCHVALSDDEKVTAFSVNGQDILPFLKRITLRPVRGSFFPLLRYAAEAENSGGDPRYGPLTTALADVLEPLAHNRTNYSKLIAYSRYLGFQDKSTMMRTLRSFELRHYRSPTSNDPFFKKIRALALANALPSILTRAQRLMAAFASGISYLGPFRQDPQRFYRQQEVAVGQIEPHGENLAMFIRALTRAQLKELSSFIQQYLGVSIDMPEEGAHVSMYIGEDNDRRHNLIDMGYGLSQVLPVFAMCWATAYGINVDEYDQPASLLAIEQPELHLHPRHQARLADMFVSVSALSRDRHREQLASSSPKLRGSESVFPLSIIVETHSEALVNRLGELVEAGTLPPEDVAVLLFHKDDSSGATKITKSTFSEDGTLRDWPLGFFAP